jgi:hypothetical protein
LKEGDGNSALNFVTGRSKQFWVMLEEIEKIDFRDSELGCLEIEIEGGLHSRGIDCFIDSMELKNLAERSYFVGTNDGRSLRLAGGWGAKPIAYQSFQLFEWNIGR